MQYLNKPIVISANPPTNTNVLWAKGNISNLKKVNITSMKQFVNGSWTEVMESSGGSDIEEVINELPEDLKVAFADPNIYLVLFKTKIKGDYPPAYGALSTSPFHQKNISPSLVNLVKSFTTFSTFDGIYGYAFYNKKWYPISIGRDSNYGNNEYEVIFLLMRAEGQYYKSSGPNPVYFNDILWSDVDEEYQSMKATWDDINS